MKLLEIECCEKNSILIKDIKKEIIAFANTNGGKAYIGIDNNYNLKMKYNFLSIKK